MEDEYINFIKKIGDTSISLSNIIRGNFEYWEPDSPPITILFAAVGRGIAQQFDNIEDENKKVVFECIEEGINSTNNVLKTAVATGIIEALVSESAKNNDLWIRIKPWLGKVSIYHADSWLTGKI